MTPQDAGLPNPHYQKNMHLFELYILEKLMRETIKINWP